MTAKTLVNMKIQLKIFKTVHLAKVIFRLMINGVFCLLFFCFLLSSCIQAPKDYYLDLSAMEKAGVQERQDTGRKIGEIVEPEESQIPIVVALQPAEEAAVLIQMIHTQPSKHGTVVEASESQSPSIPDEQDHPENRGAASLNTRVPIDIDTELLGKSLTNENITVIGIVKKDGRPDGERNVIQTFFSSTALSDDALYEQFLFICAIVYGYDKNNCTVDVVIGVAMVDAAPYMMLESTMSDYIAFADQNISYKEWTDKLVIKRF